MAADARPNFNIELIPGPAVSSEESNGDGRGRENEETPTSRSDPGGMMSPQLHRMRIGRSASALRQDW